MSERKPLTPEQREAKNRAARERRAQAKQVALAETAAAPSKPTFQVGDSSQDIEKAVTALFAEAAKANPKQEGEAEEDYTRRILHLLSENSKAGTGGGQGDKPTPTFMGMDPSKVRAAVARQLEDVKKATPKYLVSKYDHRVYTNPDYSGRLVKVGTLVERKGADGTIHQDIIPYDREPANKKERRKARAGLPFRDKAGVVA